MAATKYTKSVSTDFTGLAEGYTVPTTGKLETEIRESSITIALDYINRSGDDVDIWFKAELSSGEQTTLTGIVNVHNGIPTVEEDALRGSEGEYLTRPKFAHEGWHMHARHFDFITSTVGSLTNNKWDGTSFGDVTIRFFDATMENEYTTQQDVDAYCYVTVIDYENQHDVEALGGIYKSKIICPDSMWVSTIVAPDIPEEYGGCKAFASNLNVSFCHECHLDGRTPKYVTYDPIYHSGKFRYIFRHSLAYKFDVKICMELYEE